MVVVERRAARTKLGLGGDSGPKPLADLQESENLLQYQLFAGGMQRLKVRRASLSGAATVFYASPCGSDSGEPILRVLLLVEWQA